MKTKIIKLILIAVSLVGNFSCEKANELPPVNEGYSTSFIMPDATFLTEEDRVFIEAQEKEYEESIK